MAAGYPKVRSVEKDFPDSPNPTIVHHQSEPMVTSIDHVIEQSSLFRYQIQATIREG